MTIDYDCFLDIMEGRQTVASLLQVVMKIFTLHCASSDTTPLRRGSSISLLLGIGVSPGFLVVSTKTITEGKSFHHLVGMKVLTSYLILLGPPLGCLVIIWKGKSLEAPVYLCWSGQSWGHSKMVCVHMRVHVWIVGLE